MKKLIWAVCISIAMLSGACAAHADVVDANITADNTFSYWDDSTSSWVAGGTSWQTAENYQIKSNSTNEIYIAVQNYTGDSGNPAALLASFTDLTGTFTQTGTNTLLSNTANFQISVQPAWVNNPTVDPTTVGGWITPTSYGTNSDSSTIWNEVNGSPISGIDPNAEWIWTANNDQDFSSPGQDNFAYLRVDLSVNGNNPLGNGGVVPEPPTLLLFAFAGVLILLFNRKKTATLVRK